MVGLVLRFLVVPVAAAAAVAAAAEERRVLDLAEADLCTESRRVEGREGELSETVLSD